MAQSQSKLPDPLKFGDAKHEARVRAREISGRGLLAADPLRRAGGRRLPIAIHICDCEIEGRVRRTARAAGGREGRDAGELEGLEGVDGLDGEVEFLGGFFGDDFFGGEAYDVSV